MRAAAVGGRRKVAVFLIGPPGVGKSTVARLLAAQLGLYAVQSGQLLRDAAAHATDLQLRQQVDARMRQSLPMPVDVYCRVLRDSIPEHIPGQETDGLVFDGYPRTVEQCVSIPDVLDAARMPLGQVVGFSLDAPGATILQRSAARRVCGACGREVEGGARCCRAARIQRRADDATERLLARSSHFHELLPAVRRAFTPRWPWFDIDASRPQEQVLASIEKLLQALPQGLGDL